MLTLYFLIDTLIKVYVDALLLRIWLQWVSADFHNPLCQLIFYLTQPLVGPLRRTFPFYKKLELATLVLALLLMVAKGFLLTSLQKYSVLHQKNLLWISCLALLKSSGHLAFWLLLMRALLSWITPPDHPIDYILYQLTEPLLKPLRRYLSPAYGIDFSIALAILLMNVVNYLCYDLWGMLWKVL